METMISPRRMTSPRERCRIFSSFVFPPTRLNSSVSAKTMFMCLSKARNWPMSSRLSWMMIRILWLTHCCILPLFEAML